MNKVAKAPKIPVLEQGGSRTKGKASVKTYQAKELEFLKIRRYVEAFEGRYQALMIEYPRDTRTNQEHLAVIHSLLEELNIHRPNTASPCLPQAR